VNGMLLAAGHGSRMEPLSSLIAKPALEVLGRPLLASALEHLVGAGCRPIAVNLHRHPEQVAAAVRSIPAGADVSFSREPELLGGAGGVAAARQLLGPGPVLVANADVWTALDLTALLAATADDTVTLALLPHPDPRRWSSVMLEDDGRVASFLPAGAEPSGAPYLYTGFQLLGAGVAAALPPPPADWRPFWLALRAEGALRGAVVSGRWSEAGTPSAYRDLVLAALGGRSWVHPHAEVADLGTLERCAVGAGCLVETGARLRDCVLTAGAAIGRGARLERCVVAGAVVVERGEAIADTLVLPSRRVALAAA
jgi:NDP-sugar pyrophosphorylase family protein